MNCLHCNKSFEGRRNTKKYCSTTCKQYAYLNRSFNQPVNQNVVSNFVEENNIIPVIKNSDFSISENNNIPSEAREHNEEEYKYVDVDILNKIRQAHIASNITSNYFTRSTNYDGRINDNNQKAFVYMIPRMRCIIENLFQLTYKRKIYYRTTITIFKALQEMLFSDYIKALPGDFPFFEDLLKMYEQFKLLAAYLEEDKEGVKFTLNKTAIVRYIIILSLIRDCTEKQPFQKLFPELYKTKPPEKPNNVAT
jgi:hypothetical protein